MTKTSNLSVFAVALALLPLTACGEEDPAIEDGTMGPGGKADDVDELDPEQFGCFGSFADRSLRDDRPPRDIDRLVELNDAFARAVLKDPSAGCPLNTEDVFKKLAITDSDACIGNQTGTVTALVSELGQHKDGEEFRFDDPEYRVVSARQCGGRKPWELVLSLFGATKTRLPQNPEVISWDANAGVFNFYALEDGRWSWHGNSIDAIVGDNRCGNCHDGGGLIQKELDSPWVHWEHFDEINGGDEFFANFGSLLGPDRALDGASVEKQLIKPSWREYSKAGRIPILLADDGGRPDVDSLLRPLFCSMEINLQSGGNEKEDGNVFVLEDFFLAREFVNTDPKVFGSFGVNRGDVTIPGAVYNQVIADIGQNLRGAPGEVDTHRRFTYPERSYADAAAVSEMLARGILDKDLVADVLMVDFTRPVFSFDRCNLLDIAVDRGAFDDMKSGSDVTPFSIRDALVATLSGAKVPGADDLIEALQNANDDDAQFERREQFLAACTARMKDHPEEFTLDLMHVSSWKKGNAIRREGPDGRGPTHIIEDPDTMLALDELDPVSPTFDDVDCCVGGRTCSAR